MLTDVCRAGVCAACRSSVCDHHCHHRPVERSEEEEQMQALLIAMGPMIEMMRQIHLPKMTALLEEEFPELGPPAAERIANRLLSVCLGQS